MKKNIIILLFAASCFVTAKTIDITILHTTDLHGHLLPTTDYDGNNAVGGIFQLATVIEKLRAENPNNLLVDNGDTFQGTLISHANQGNSIIKCLNALGYNIWNLGNHEFDWGIDVLSENLKRFSGKIINANLHWSGTTPSPFKKVQPFVIENIKGIKIAFIGLNHPGIPFWSRNFLIKKTVIEDPVVALLRVMPEVIAEKPDAIILIMHSGYNEETHELETKLKEVLNTFPDIDVVIGGHTHTTVPNIMFGKTLYTQAGYYGIVLGDLQLTFDSETRKLIQKKAIIIPVGPDEIQSDKIKKLVKIKLENTKVEATKTICFVEGVLGGIAPEDMESPLQTLISEAIVDSVNADVVFHGSFSSGCIISNSEMTVADLYKIIPYENRIVTAKLTANEITYLVDSMLEYWGTPSFNFPYGLKIKIDVDGLPGERVISIRDKNKKPLNSDKRYTVAFNSYVAASGGKEFIPVKAVLSKQLSLTKDVPLTTRESVLNFLKKQKNYKPHTEKIVEHVKGNIGQFIPITQNSILKPGPLQIFEFSYMHPGSRSEEQAGEWFVIKNAGKEIVNLKGYSISDRDEGGRFRIKKDVKLASGEFLLFCCNSKIFQKHTYAGNPYLRIFEYGKLAGRLNLGNRGDELMLIDSQGRLADQVVYGSRKKLWKNWPAESKAPNHKVGESLIKKEGGWEVNAEPLSEL